MTKDEFQRKYRDVLLGLVTGTIADMAAERGRGVALGALVDRCRQLTDFMYADLCSGSPPKLNGTHSPQMAEGKASGAAERAVPGRDGSKGPIHVRKAE